ncbi:hypothetical protein DFP95_111100 [Cohnella lupini]|uniref:Uncharacterized protein n=1 Tax=Cohnella lupini TaxID=1294267 RepID=A0A3D9I7N9_9BACL|nr:hypothetical protein DFP95_111100 [Cohnella lupini]
MQNSIITASFTILGGIIIFIVSQLFLKIVLEPLAEFKKLKGKITFALIYHANVYSSPRPLTEMTRQDEPITNASKDFRTLASELLGYYQQLSCKRIVIRFKAIPNRENINDASRCLIGLANGLNCDPESSGELRKSNLKHRDDLGRILGLYLGRD